MAELVCPWWLGYFLVNPLRRFLQDPQRICAPYVKEGMQVLDLGCGMGYFSLPLARMAGARGKVVCVDLQEKMLWGLMRRAHAAGLAERIEPRRASPSSLQITDLRGTADFALAFAMVHEVPDREHFFHEIAAALKPGSRMLVAEPRGHVTPSAFKETIRAAAHANLAVIDRPKIRFSHAALFARGV